MDQSLLIHIYFLSTSINEGNNVKYLYQFIVDFIENGLLCL